jgi:hypothetical protein
MACQLFHLVDLGGSCSAALDDPLFRNKCCIPPAFDLSRQAITVDPAFSSLKAVQGQPMLPLADVEAAVYTLVLLASGGLPWACGMEEPTAGQ